MIYDTAVILINYEKYEDTIECLKSLENVKEGKFITIIVDNASLNKSVYYIEEYCSQSSLETRIIILNENSGFSAGNNEGIRAGLEYGVEYFVMLNNDTVVDENFLSELIRPFEVFDNVGATTGEIYYEKERQRIWYAGGMLRGIGKIPAHVGYREKEEHHISEMRDVTFASGCCICCSRKCIEEIDGWDESFFLYEEDVDFSFRIMEAGYRIIYNSDSIIYHKVSSTTKTLGNLSQIYSIRNRLYFVKKHCFGIEKLLAYVINTTFLLKRVATGDYSIGNVMKGINYFIKRKMGKIC